MLGEVRRQRVSSSPARPAAARVVIAGEAGLGKTRLDARTRAEVAAIAHRDGLVPVGK